MSVEKGKLFVFDRIEVFFILILIILVAVISFTFGIKVGKEYSYESHGFTPQDRKTVEMKSEEEEEMLKIDESQVKVNKDQVQKDHSKKLAEKFEKIKQGSLAPEIKNKKLDSKIVPMEAKKKYNEYRGKWTIQLGTYENWQEAQKFADGFKMRGYYPIINEVSIKNRGVWYRVGLGVYDSIAIAKSYIETEQILFQSQDYTIVKLQ